MAAHCEEGMDCKWGTETSMVGRDSLPKPVSSYSYQDWKWHLEFIYYCHLIEFSLKNGIVFYLH